MNRSIGLIIIFLLFVMTCITSMLLAIIPNIIAPHIETYCTPIFGEDYIKDLLIIFVASTIISLLLSIIGYKGWLNPTKKDFKNISIPHTKENKTRLAEAKKQILKSRVKKGIIELRKIDSEIINERLDALEMRLSKFKTDDIKGIQSEEQHLKEFNKLCNDILQFIRSLEANFEKEVDVEQEVKTYLTKKYTNRLQQKLASRQPINLQVKRYGGGTSKETQAGFVAHDEVNIKQDIFNIFKDAKERLLVLGSPGAGKTTLLLQLVLALLEKEKYGIPVVLNLATWQSKYETLDKWLLEILPTELGANKTLVEEILQNTPLILLLDGFDEIKEENRTSCLEAIGKYSANNKNRYVISSRKDEYKAVDKDAAVRYQVIIGTLTIQQIKKELQRLDKNGVNEAKRLLNAIQTNPNLEKVVQNPFYFNTLQLMFAKGQRLVDIGIKSEDDIKTIQDSITRHFVNTILGDNIKDKHYLSFFAFQTTEHNLVVFELVDLGYSWWNEWKSRELLLALILRSLVLHFSIALSISASISFFIGIFFNWYAGLFFFLISFPFGMFFPMLQDVIFLFTPFVVNPMPNGFLDKNPKVIYTKDYINWSWQMIPQMLINFLVTLAIVMIMMLIIALITKESLISGLSTGLIIWLMTIMGMPLILVLNNYSSSIQMGTPYQRFINSAKLLHFSILQHFILRFQLYRKNVLPLRLVAFLNKMKDQHLLESDGATWRFRHRILQEHFAAMWEEKQKQKNETKKGN